MFSAPQRHLPYPLDRASNLERVVPEGLEVCGLPEFPEDSDEQITVLFRLSLNQFVALATAIDVGSDIAYGDDGIPVWFLWAASVMCASFCEEMATCLEEQNEDVVAALAELIATNPIMWRAVAAAAAAAGTPVPGTEIPTDAARQDALPDNVKNEFGACNLDALWGASLGLVQFGNRAIVDFFEILEVASNALERGAIATGAIPAAGNSLSSAIEFADQIMEEVAEGYAAVYTETYEQELACALFCAARQDCELNIDEIIRVLQERLALDEIEDFYAVMQWVITGTYTGSQLADTAFLLFFTAIKFGTEFAGVVGVRALTVYMGLSADVLASDNWETLCECPANTAQLVGVILNCGEGVIDTVDFEDGVPFDMDAYEFTGLPGSWCLALKLPSGNWEVTLNSITGTIVPPVDENQSVYAWFDPVTGFNQIQWNAPATPDDFGTHDTTAGMYGIWCDSQTWNAILFNEGAFTANFTVTAI